MTALRLDYDSPARSWTDALPLGNGRIGAMVFGGVALDRFQINDDRAWSGSPATTAGTPLIAPGEGPQVLAEVRAALVDGDTSRAEKISTRLQHGHSQAFQPLVDLWWAMDGAPAGPYRRHLDLRDAVAHHDVVSGGVRVRQDSWVSAPHQALVVDRQGHDPDGSGARRLGRVELRLDSRHPTASYATWTTAPGRGRFESVVRMPSRVVPPHEDLPDPVRYADAPGRSVTLVVGAEVLTDGTVESAGDRLVVTGATRIVLVLVTEADFTGPLHDPHGDVARLRHAAAGRLDGLVARVAGDGADGLRAEHVAAHRALFDRVDLQLGPPPDRPCDVDERLRRYAAGVPDPALPALVFHYGRYLLLAGSRPGTLPMHLQGLWNDKVRPPWSSNYTTNINLEMNYWPAEVVGLPECHLPLLDWLHAAAVRGTAVARELYGAGGWTMHHNSDAWAFALPAGEGDADPCWSFWPLGAAWLCRHVWEHYDFTRDTARLAADWPVVRSAAEFGLDWLFRDPDGALGTLPSTSPENAFVDGAERHALTWSSTSDLLLLADLFARSLDMLADLAGLVPDDPEFVDRARAALAELAPDRVLADGRLAEWARDLVEAEPEHRHTSHLLGVYPLDRIVGSERPDLAEAARRSLDARGPRSTGWALAWRLALRARLRDAAGAGVALTHFLAPMAPDASDEPSMTAPAGLYRNLFCAHPPFQIDGNLGVTAAVAELLLGSRSVGSTSVLDLLPCLLPGWDVGRFAGLRARGGLTVSASWRAGRLEVEVSAVASRRVVVRHGPHEVAVDVGADPVRLVLADGCWTSG